MPRLLKALPLMLAIGALSIVTTGCGTGNSSVRVVNAIPNVGGNGGISLDVYFNGTKDCPGLGFPDVYPAPTTPASYTSVPSGKDTIQAYDANTTTGPIFGEGWTGTLGSNHYTMLLGGEIGETGVNSYPPTVYLIPDNNYNTAPTEGNVEIRVINGSTYSAPYGGISGIIFQTGTGPPSYPYTFTFTGLQLGQSTDYLPLTWESSYSIELFLDGTETPLFSPIEIPQSGSSTSGGQITTVVIVDYNNSGNIEISPYPLVLVDLN